MFDVLASLAKCSECNSDLEISVSHDPKCDTCKGVGMVDTYTGGGTEPPAYPGAPPVYGLKISRGACPDGKIITIKCPKVRDRDGLQSG